MKKFTTISLMLFLNFIHSAYAFEDQAFVSAGFGFSYASLKTKFIEQRENGELEDETKTFALGVSTRFAYRRTTREYGIASDVGFGRVKDVTVKNSETTFVQGNGHYRVITINPYIKQNLPFTIGSHWSPYFGGGPAWSLQTLTITELTRGNSSIDNKKRISFENFGASLILGLEENLQYKEMHPTYIEFGYSLMANYQVSVVDATNLSETKLISSRKAKEFYGSFFFVRVGMVLF
jgi:hypothetical protein